MTLHRKKPKMARAWWRCDYRLGLRVVSDRVWGSCYRWHKAVKP